MKKRDSKKIIITVRALVEHNGSYLMLRKSSTSARAGDWELPGGHLEEGESLSNACRRELLEETGLVVADVAYFRSSPYSYKGDPRLGVLFTTKSSDQSITLSDEHDEYRWLDSSNLDSIKLNDYYLSIFNNIFKTEVKDTSMKDIDDNHTPHVKHLTAYTDGGSRGNPGPSATGYVLLNEHGSIIEKGGEYLGITTNNQAEYQAVKFALKSAKKFNPQKIDFFIDSLLVVKQMNGEFKVKNRDLWPIHESIKEIVATYEEVTFTHIRRENNTLADEQVNKILDEYQHSNRT